MITSLVVLCTLNSYLAFFKNQHPHDIPSYLRYIEFGNKFNTSFGIHEKFDVFF